MRAGQYLCFNNSGVCDDVSAGGVYLGIPVASVAVAAILRHKTL